MTKRVKYVSLQNILLALLCIVLFAISGRFVSSAFAVDKQYTGVMTDLCKDKDFDPTQYPNNAKDYSIQVIQIAESANKELFVFTYQPCQSTTYLVATEVNMSLTDKVEDTKLYGLTLLSCSGIFCKYRVNGVKVSSADERYYNITSISRVWDNNIDGDPIDENNNRRETVVYPVGRCCTARTFGDNVDYTYTGVDYATVVGKYTGKMFDQEQRGLVYHKTTEYYVAFESDLPIDKLMTAKVSYDVVTIGDKYGTVIDRSPRKYVVCDSEKYSEGTYNKGFFGWGNGEYKWKTIYTVEEFTGKHELIKPEELHGKEWVIVFYHNEIDSQKLGLPYPTDAPGDVTILELSFFTDGRFYDLGIVDNKQTGDGKNDLKPNKWNLWDWLASVTGIAKWVWILVFVSILALPILGVLSFFFPVIGLVLKTFFNVLCNGLRWFFVGIWWLICLPFKGIATLVRKIRDKKDGAS